MAVQLHKCPASDWQPAHGFRGAPGHVLELLGQCMFKRKIKEILILILKSHVSRRMASGSTHPIAGLTASSSLIGRLWFRPWRRRFPLLLTPQKVGWNLIHIFIGDKMTSRNIGVGNKTLSRNDDQAINTEQLQ